MGEQHDAPSTVMAERRDATLEAMRLSAALDEQLRALCALTLTLTLTLTRCGGAARRVCS